MIDDVDMPLASPAYANDPLITNARRLASDAALLLENERLESALALAILSVEEIGKFLLLKSNEKGHSNHLTKLKAASTLLHLISIEKFMKANGYQLAHKNDQEKSHLLIYDVGSDTISNDYLESITKSKLLRYNATTALIVGSRFLNDVKQNSLYRDIVKLSRKYLEAGGAAHVLGVSSDLIKRITIECQPKLKFSLFKEMFCALHKNSVSQFERKPYGNVDR